MDQTREHLRLLSIFHYVVGGLGFLFSFFPIFHLAFGIVMMVAPVEEGHSQGMSETMTPAVEEPDFEIPEPPSEPYDTHPEDTETISETAMMRVMGGIFTGVAAFLMLGGFALSTAIVIAGRRLAAYRSHTYCLVIAAIECLFMPLGTVLGVFTIIVLIRPEARDLFGLPRNPEAPSTS